MQEARSRRDVRDRESADELAARLSSATIRVPARAGADGRLFGSVTTADIAEAVLAQTQVELDRRKLHLDEPIRAAGVHRVPIRLHPEVDLELTVEVTPQA
jgi:large subunit ribosomal protein L9